MIPGAMAIATLTILNLNPWHVFAWRRAEDVLRFWGVQP